MSVEPCLVSEFDRGVADLLDSELGRGLRLDCSRTPQSS
jgi:hypothetical protein